MGSGETAPTMVKTHRGLMERVGGTGALLDTPYGFQENADDISARAQEYFRASVGRPITVASLRRADADAVTVATAVARLTEAGYVFAGPGSPTYALSVWAGTPVPALVADKLRSGGAVTFASAAALTLGLVTVPVYEVYKCGATPEWRDGLDLLSAVGLRVAVIPHYDNAEGGNHDTRFCYLGERRLAIMERQLPDGAFVLGVDEHTACSIDVANGSVAVVGLGGVTVRSAGYSTVFPTGAELTVDDLLAAAAGRSGSAAATAESQRARAAERAPAGSGEQSRTASPLLVEADRLEAEFAGALARRDVAAAVAAILELENALVAWSADTLQSDEPDRVRATVRSMIVRLGELAMAGMQDPAAAIAPLVDVLLEQRAAARGAKNWARSDEIRDQLAAAGVEVRDTAGGQEWVLRAGGEGGAANVHTLSTGPAPIV